MFPVERAGARPFSHLSPLPSTTVPSSESSRASGSPSGRTSGPSSVPSSGHPSRHPPRRWAAWTLAILGAGSLLLGALSVGTYVHGVLDVIGESDQSWIFWGLVFLFCGLGALVTGFVLLFWARHLFRRKVVISESEL